MGELLSSKLAVVTGASGDIGSDVALLLAEEGAEVIATYNSRKKEAEKLEGRRGLRITAEKLDVGDEAAVKRFFAALEESSRRPDILVNAAGHSSREIWFGRPEELDPRAWTSVYMVDVVGSFNCAREAAALMNGGRGGSIVNFSSAAGVTGHTEGLPYTAAKAALIAVTKSLARMYAPRVRVNAVAPGNIDAGSIRWYAKEQIRRLASESPLGRLGSRREVSNAVLFLASDLSSFVTGQTILVDGGI
ncbi:MAG: SDR family oxidoreductase [Nitrososphaerota archaeon]|nr:SDR family oxidoreductase [Nitrososphaerota archaeon]MDG6939736.1 SDR family oxidoreductase [Nitrososphaerota archaeon]